MRRDGRYKAAGGERTRTTRFSAHVARAMMSLIDALEIETMRSADVLRHTRLHRTHCSCHHDLCRESGFHLRIRMLKASPTQTLVLWPPLWPMSQASRCG